MTEQIFLDIHGHEIILAVDVRATILQKHPEATLFIDRLADILRDPDEIRQSERDERSVLYYCYMDDVLNGKWVVAVVKRIDRNFIATLYATDQIKSGEQLWKKNV